MLGLTTLGSVHTIISLVALLAGIIALMRDREISPRNGIGQAYIWATIITCLTGFGIFQHGGFGKPHALGVMTLLVLALVTFAARTTLFGAAAKYIVAIGYSLTFFFHIVPGLTETFTRVPVGNPLFSNPEDPALAKVIGICFMLFLIGAYLQARRLRAQDRQNPARFVRAA